MDFSGLRAAYAGRRVLVTGHTGFKGAWLCEWLLGSGRRGAWLGFAGAGGVLAFWRIPSWSSGWIMRSLIFAMRRRCTRRSRGYDRRSFCIWLRSRWCGFPIASRWKLLRPMCWARRICSTLCAAAEFPCSIVVVTSDKCYANDGRRARFSRGRSAGRARSLQREQGCGGDRDGFVPRFVFRTGQPRGAGFRARGQRHWRRRLGGGSHRAGRDSCAGKGRSQFRCAILRSRGPWQHVLEPLRRLFAAGGEAGSGARQPVIPQAFAQSFNFGPDPGGEPSGARAGGGNLAALGWYGGSRWRRRSICRRRRCLALILQRRTRCWTGSRAGISHAR